MSRARRIALPVAVVLALGTVPAALATTGQITEFSNGITSNAGLYDIVAGPDGNLWFTEANHNAIGRITPTGSSVHEFTSGITGTNLTGIALGPDGNLWFTECNSDAVGRITPAGAVHEFTSGITSGACPAGIAAGPDGNLWFTEEGRNAIGRITTSGSVQEFTTGISSPPQFITAGGDGNLWFTEFSNATIGRITTSGTVHEFSIGITTGSEPDDIAAGPDGNLWFTEHQGDRIGRITTSGTVHEFSTGITAAAGPLFITAGPDGNLWFTEYQHDAIGRITPLGQVTEFTAGISPAAGLSGITAGPDGNLWFVEQAANKIGRAWDAVAGTRYDLVRDYSFVPKTWSAAQGNTVKWMFLGPNRLSLADTSGMNLFRSGSRSFVTFYPFVFNAAGTYPYDNPGHTAMTGTVTVPEKASPSSGHLSTTFSVTWSATKAPTGYVFDVQIKRPGSTSYKSWKTGVTTRTASFKPDHGKGKYAFRSRLRKESNDAHVGWSPAATISVT